MGTRNIVRIIILSASLGLGWAQAYAAGFQVREQSAEGLGNAFAGSTAKAYDLSTLFYNPAGMARLDGNGLGMDGAWIAPYSHFEGGNTVGGTAVVGSDGGNHAQAMPVGAAYAMWSLAPDWRLGVAVAAPFGMHSHYREDWVGRYQALETSVTTVNLSPSVSYRVDDRLSVALGMQFGYIDTLQTNAINFDALVPGAADGLFRVTGDDVALGWTASLLYQFSPGTRLGLSYRSAVHHTIHGRAEFQGVPGALANTVAFADSDVETVITLPDTASLGLYHELSSQWAVMGDVSWTRWSAFRTLRLNFESGRPDAVVSENWHDTWFTALGVTYRPNERLSLRVGTAYDTAAVDDRWRNARLPDSDRIWLSAGLTYEPSPGHSFSLSYAHIFANSVSIDQTDPGGTGGHLTGRFDNHVDLVSASYVMRF